mmetsp:Transcript_5071/g.7001  ORF Transcript_5071/g.7001 Transcript_5071/m.7001 type:complete len:536 (+) Transcript_5071:278-1885(+)
MLCEKILLFWVFLYFWTGHTHPYDQSLTSSSYINSVTRCEPQTGFLEPALSKSLSKTLHILENGANPTTSASMKLIIENGSTKIKMGISSISNYELNGGDSGSSQEDLSTSSYTKKWQLPWGSRTLIRRLKPVKGQQRSVSLSYSKDRRGQEEEEEDLVAAYTSITPACPLPLMQVSSLDDFPALTDQWGLEGPQGVFTSEGSESFTGTPIYEEPATGRTFTVLQFNMLAHCHAHSHIFPFAPEGFLKSRQRWEDTVTEILQYQADVVCLQEVDQIDDLNIYMAKAGYKGIFKQKGGGRKDGVAIFFKENSVSLLTASHVKYGKENQDGVGLFAALVPHGSARPFCVATTHLYWHPRCETVRLNQAEIFLEALQGFCRRLEVQLGMAEQTLPVVLTGDLNTRPGAKAYTLIQKGDILDEESNRVYHHGFGSFRSAYSFYSETFPPQVTGMDDREARVRWGERDHNEQAFGEPAFTSCTEVFACTLDYIWYLEDQLQLTELLELPSFEHAAQDRGLPSKNYPSDHVSLMAKFQLPP